MSDGQRRNRAVSKVLLVAVVGGALAVPAAAIAQAGGTTTQTAPSASPPTTSAPGTTAKPSTATKSSAATKSKPTTAATGKKKDREDRLEKAGRIREGSAADKRGDRGESRRVHATRSMAKKLDRHDRGHAKSRAGGTTARR
jgi:hypothetical protein